MGNTSLTYNPRFGVGGGFNQFASSLYHHPTHYGAYPNTFTQNNTLERTDWSDLILSDDEVTFLENLGNQPIPSAIAPVDNAKHDINPNNSFRFHEADNGFEDTAYFSGYSNIPLATNMFNVFANQLFTSSYNYHFTTPDGRTGYNLSLIHI